MKTFTNSLLIAIFSSVILTSCGKDKPVTSETNEVSTSKEGMVYEIDTLNSRMERLQNRKI